MSMSVNFHDPDRAVFMNLPAGMWAVELKVGDGYDGVTVFTTEARAKGIAAVFAGHVTVDLSDPGALRAFILGHAAAAGLVICTRDEVEDALA